MVGTRTSDFEQFLLARLGSHQSPIGHACDWAGTGNTIGALALRLGVLTLDQIDRILDLQEEDRRRFGELAVHLGYITNDQVQRLIDLQKFHQLLEIGEHYVMEGSTSVDELQHSLSEFYAQPPADSQDESNAAVPVSSNCG